MKIKINSDKKKNKLSAPNSSAVVLFTRPLAPAMMLLNDSLTPLGQHFYKRMVCSWRGISGLCLVCVALIQLFCSPAVYFREKQQQQDYMETMQYE